MKSSKRSRGGRPSRATASAKALKGIVPADVDPKRVLQEIAADTSAPAAARLGAAKALLALIKAAEPQKPVSEDDEITERAIKRLRAVK